MIRHHHLARLEIRQDLGQWVDFWLSGNGSIAVDNPIFFLGPPESAQVAKPSLVGVFIFRYDQPMILDENDLKVLDSDEPPHSHEVFPNNTLPRSLSHRGRDVHVEDDMLQVDPLHCGHVEEPLECAVTVNEELIGAKDDWTNVPIEFSAGQERSNAVAVDVAFGLLAILVWCVRSSVEVGRRVGDSVGL